MNTSDRQITETGRNRELGLIPAMVMAIIAALSGLAYRSRHYMSESGAA